MIESRRLRVFRSAPSLLLFGWLLAACATAPSGPPAPISSGQERMEPDLETDTTETDETETDLVETDESEIDEYVPLVPPHMYGRDIKRAAILLPFTHSNRNVRDEAQSLLAAIELALFEIAGDQILILPKDTEGNPETAALVAQEALNEGAEVFIGPLFSRNVSAVGELSRENDIPMIAFSNDKSVAGDGAYLLSLTPEEEVARAVEWASLQGISKFALLGPGSTYGRRVQAALEYEVVRRGGTVVATEFYSPSNDGPVDESRRLAETLKRETGVFNPKSPPQPFEKVAVIIPERGIKLRSVAPLIPYYGVDLRFLQLIGTGLWNDPTVWREPTLFGGVFAAPNPSDVDLFDSRFTSTYSRDASDLASLGYDAAALVFSLMNENLLERNELESSDGFRGVNGLFRFREDGTVERGLAILKITPQGVQLAEPGRTSFGVDGT